MEQNLKRKKRKKSTYVLWTVLFLVFLGLAFNSIATERLNKKYNSVVAWDSELQSYCEYDGNEYLVSGKCKFLQSSIGAGVQIFHINYDEQHTDIHITWSVTENKFGKCVYTIGFGDSNDSNFGGYLYIDENFNPISQFGERIDKDAVELMNDLHEEVERVVEIANDKWDLGLHYEYKE